MPALDAIASYQGTSGSTLAAGTTATGDSTTIRNFGASAHAYLCGAFYDDVTTPLAWRVRSPLLHDNVQGIRFGPGAAAPAALWPLGVLQELEAQDQLTIELSTAASTGKALGVVQVFYTDLPGATARLRSWGDIAGIIRNVKPVTVAIGSGANTAGQWLDTVITTTENLLRANTDYAVFGATLDVAVAALAVKGLDTGNLRAALPGGVNNPFGPYYFRNLAAETGLPTIPVINSANAGSTYVSIVSAAATAAASTFTLYLAELSQSVGS